MTTLEMAGIAIAAFGVICFLCYLDVLLKRYFKRRDFKKTKRAINSIVPRKTLEELRRIYEDSKHGL